MAMAAIFRSITGRKAEAGLLSNAMLVLLIASIACLASCVKIEPMPNAPTTSTEPFPRPGDFTEGYTPQSGAILNGLQSTYSGTLAVTMMDRSAVARVLPPGFRLAQPSNNPTTRHPVIHLIGDQLEPSTLIGGYPVNVGTGYREMVLLVPYVVRDSGSGLYNFAARMFLTDPTAVIGGNEIFGYAKVLAQLNRAEASTRTNYQVATLDGSTTWVFDQIDLTGPWAPASTPLPRWQDLREIFQLPILGLRPADGVLPAQFICSYWEWNFDQAELAAARSNHRFVTKFLDGTEEWVSAGQLQSAPDGAVAIRRLRWRLAALPTAC